MTVKNLFSIKSAVFFIFLCWAEVLIFTTTLFLSIWAGDLVNLTLEKLIGNRYYLFSAQLRIAPKIFFLFCFLGAAQFLFSDFLRQKSRKSVYFFLYLSDACAVSIFFINPIIKKTEMRDYNFLWLGVMIVMLTASLHLLTGKNRENHSHTPLRR